MLCGPQFKMTEIVEHESAPNFVLSLNIPLCGNYHIFRTIRCIFAPLNLGGKWGCVLQSECSVPDSLGAGGGGSGAGFFVFLFSSSKT